MTATTKEEAFGDRLRRIREDRGLSQRDVASEHVSPAYISRLEHGDRRATQHTIRALAAKLDVTPDELEFGEAGIKANPTFRAMQRRIIELEKRLRRYESAAVNGEVFVKVRL